MQRTGGGVKLLAVTYVLSLSLPLFFLCMLLIDFHYIHCRALSLHLISLSFFLLVTTPFWFFLSSSQSLFFFFLTAIISHLSCAHRLLLAHHFIEYIRGFHSPIIRHATVAPGITSSCFSGGRYEPRPLPIEHINIFVILPHTCMFSFPWIVQCFLSERKKAVQLFCLLSINAMI
jgi:hypothetical protein